MNSAEIQDAVQRDMRFSPLQTVVYLEGKTDVDYLFALLGKKTPLGDGGKNFLHQGILVKACVKGSGSTAVRSHVDVGKKLVHEGLVYGIIDGDGLPLAALSGNFDAPHNGPLFAWKAYCIENLLVKTGWPTAWGIEPDWRVQLSNYGPYVALNRIGSEVRSILEGLGLMKFTNPVLGGSYKPSTEIVAALAAGKNRLQSFDVEQRYVDEVSAFQAIVQQDLDEAHALLNGKWLVRHMAPALTTHDPDQCEYDWLAHARSVGGLPEVREWWERITGNPP